MNIAKFEKRILSYIIDFLIPIALTIFGMYVGLTYFPSFQQIPWFYFILIVIFILWFLYTLINTLFLYISNGRTIGNLIVRIKVVHPNLERLTFKDCLCRSASLGVFILVIINAVYIFAVHTEKTVVDRLTKTIAVDWHRNRY